MINQAFAARYLAGVDPLGQRLPIGSPDQPRPWTTIVGVVADYRNNGVTQPVRPEIYIPVRQQTAWNQLFMLVRTDGSPAGLLPSARQTVSSLDPEQPVYMIQTLDEALATSSFQQRISAVLLSIFAGVALVLAAIGIYGVMSYAVTARTQEMGVRLAIGAQRRDVIWLVLGQVLRLSAIGLAIGDRRADRCRPGARGPAVRRPRRRPRHDRGGDARPRRRGAHRGVGARRRAPAGSIRLRRFGMNRPKVQGFRSSGFKRVQGFKGSRFKVRACRTARQRPERPEPYEPSNPEPHEPLEPLEPS